MSLEKLILPVILVQLFQSLLASAMGGPLYRQIVASLVKKFVFSKFRKKFWQKFSKHESTSEMRDLEHRLENKQTFIPVDEIQVQRKLNRYDGKFQKNEKTF